MNMIVSAILIICILMIYWVFKFNKYANKEVNKEDKKENINNQVEYYKKIRRKAISLTGRYKNKTFEEILQDFSTTYSYIEHDEENIYNKKVKLQDLVINMIEIVYEVHSLTVTPEGMKEVWSLITEYIKTYNKLLDDEKKEKKKVEEKKFESGKEIEKEMASRLSEIKESLKNKRKE